MPKQEHEAIDLLHGHEQIKSLLRSKFIEKSDPIDAYYQFSATTSRHALPLDHPLQSFEAIICELNATNHLLKAIAYSPGDNAHNEAILRNLTPIDHAIEKLFSSIRYETMIGNSRIRSIQTCHTSPEGWVEGLNGIAQHLLKLENITNNLTLDTDPAKNQLLHDFLEDQGVYSRMFGLIESMEDTLKMWNPDNVRALPKASRPTSGFYLPQAMITGLLEDPHYEGRVVPLRPRNIDQT